MVEKKIKWKMNIYIYIYLFTYSRNKLCIPELSIKRKYISLLHESNKKKY